MHHRLDAIDDERVIEPVNVLQVADDQAVGRHGLPVAGRQIVVRPGFVAVVQQQSQRVAADITGSARNQDAHASLT
jgi:hypothetical protein